MPKPQPWNNADATDAIRAMGSDPGLTLSYSAHAKEQMEERDLIISDILYVLKHGFVLTDSKPATKVGLHKYSLETRTPNSNNRSVRVVVIPDLLRCWIKIVTVMWVD